jgi:septum formation protein
MKIILGSSSKWRKKILEDAGYKFEIMAADIDEKKIRSDNYELLPLLIARGKADFLLAKIKEPALLITSDQVVVCEDELREKPRSKREAEKFLASYSQFPVKSITSVVAVNTASQKKAEGVDIATVYFNKIPSHIIQEFIASEDAFACAGGFSISHPLLKPLVSKVEGNRDCVIGLPMNLTEKLVKRVTE